MDMSNQFTISDPAAKCKSKSEFYNLLSTEGGMHQPPVQNATQTYLRRIMMRKRSKSNKKCNGNKGVSL